MPTSAGGWFIVVLLALTAIGAFLWAFWPHHGPGVRRDRRRAQERDDFLLGPDKPPYQPKTPTAEHPAPRKLPGQDRLTRDDRTGMGASSTPQDLPTAAIPAADAVRSSGGGLPSQREEMAAPAVDDPDPTSLMRAVRPPVPGAPIPPRPWPAQPAESLEPEPEPEPAPEPPLPPANVPRETRAERRRRLEAEAKKRPERP